MFNNASPMRKAYAKTDGDVAPMELTKILICDGDLMSQLQYS